MSSITADVLARWLNTVNVLYVNCMALLHKYESVMGIHDRYSDHAKAHLGRKFHDKEPPGPEAAVLDTKNESW